MPKKTEKKEIPGYAVKLDVAEFSKKLHEDHPNLFNAPNDADKKERAKYERNGEVVDSISELYEVHIEGHMDPLDEVNYFSHQDFCQVGRAFLYVFESGSRILVVDNDRVSLNSGTHCWDILKWEEN